MVDGGNAADPALVVGRLGRCCLSIADALLRVEADHGILAGGVLRRSQPQLNVTAGEEMKGLRELQVALVGKLVDEARAVVEVAFEHLAHERLGVRHVLQAIGLHGVCKEPLVVEEIVDRLHVVDVGEIVLGLTRNLGLGRSGP